MKVLPNVSQAAENTPEHRDRIVDAVRGVSLVVVVFGHLLLAVVYWPENDPPRLGSLMLAYPWTQVLTWILQVMPLFFLPVIMHQGREGPVIVTVVEDYPSNLR